MFVQRVEAIENILVGIKRPVVSFCSRRPEAGAGDHDGMGTLSSVNPLALVFDDLPANNSPTRSLLVKGSQAEQAFMADDLDRGIPRDRRRVNINDDLELRWWCSWWDVSPEQLRAAVKAAGVEARDVAHHLGRVSVG